MPAQPNSNNVWITGAEACKIIDRAPTVLSRLARNNEIRSESHGGLPPVYHRADCERIAKLPRAPKQKRVKKP